MTKYLNRYITKEEIQMAKIHKGRCLISLVVRKMPIKIMRYHYMPIRMIKT